MKPIFGHWRLGFLLALLIAIPFGYFFVDRPLSEYLRALNQSAPSLINFFRAITDLGKSQWVLVPAGLLTLGSLLSLRLRRKDDRWRPEMKKLACRAGFLFSAVAVSGLLVNLLKILFGRARPKLLSEDGIFGFFWLQNTADYWSFPSGHANTAFAFALALSLLFPKLRLPAFAFAIILAASRVIVNAHYFSDVLGGLAAALFSTAILAALFFRLNWLQKT